MEQDILCRLCAEGKESFIKIYEEEGQKLNLATKIIQCLQIWLYPEDPLPKTVCIECCGKLNQYFDFFEKTSRSQISLQIIFDQKVTNKVKREVDSNSIKRRRSSSQEVTSTEHASGKIKNEDTTSPIENQEEQGIDAEPPEFVECVLTEKDNLRKRNTESPSASSRRKCRIPVKRTALDDENDENAPKDRINTRERISTKSRVSTRTAPRVQTIPNQPTKPQDCMPLQERLLIKERTDKQVVESELEDSILSDGGTSIQYVRKTEHHIEKKNSELEAADNQNCQEMMSTSDQLKNYKNSKSAKRKRDTKAVEKPPRPKAVLDGYPWQCTTCPAVLGSLQELRLHHLNVHEQPATFKCVQCAKTYTRYRSFARHVKLHRNPKKFECEVCGKCFSQKTVLQSHRTVHTDDRPHVCPQCGKTFKQFSSLYLHSKCHLPDQVKPKFPCDICNKDFATKHTLETHRKIHTGERNFICDVCGKSFIAKGSLDYHILTHSGEKPHHCPICGKGFKTPRLLNKHSTLHTGIKPHQCDVCGKQFRERGALREHGRIHTGAMPYTCEFCGKNFRFKGILTVHRRQHTGERPYSCVECRREFTNWANYNKHMKRRHRNPDDPSASSSNRVTSARTFEPPPGIPDNSVQPMPPQPPVNSMVPEAVSLGNSYNLSQHTVVCDSSSNSNSVNSITHMSISQPVVPMSNSASLYSNPNHLSKMSNMYGPQTIGNGMNAGITNKMHPANSLSSVFHGGNTVVGGLGNSGHKLLGNVFHGSHQQESSDSLERTLERSQHNNHLMSSYHMPSYVSNGLPMGSMGYYIPPIHHAEHGMDMLHNRMGSNQLSGNS